MRISDTVFCDGCGVEITWAPVRSGQHDYCCQDCADGYECSCGARMEDEDDSRGRGESASGVTAGRNFGEGY
jgi:hypothetical protein